MWANRRLYAPPSFKMQQLEPKMSEKQRFQLHKNQEISTKWKHF